MSNVSFPAAHLSAYDLGKRIQAVTVDGAKVTDKLVRITGVLTRSGHPFLYLSFENTLSARSLTHMEDRDRGFLVNLDQMVKRVGE